MTITDLKNGMSILLARRRGIPYDGPLTDGLLRAMYRIRVAEDRADLRLVGADWPHLRAVVERVNPAADPLLRRHGHGSFPRVLPALPQREQPRNGAEFVL